jgi:DNA (cytosine-5)-methyltransferase 1
MTNTVGINELALFAGAGGGILAGKLLGWRTICAVEKDAYCQSVLLARQADGILPLFPIWDDVTTFDGRPWAGIVNVISGGFPCQDISTAGKGKGITGPKSGLWKHMARIVSEVRPRFVFVENSANLIRRGIETVIGDLAQMGYDARWGVIGADDVGAPHRRKRIWIVADSCGFSYGDEIRNDSLEKKFNQPSYGCKNIPNPASERLERTHNVKKSSERIQSKPTELYQEKSNRLIGQGRKWPAEPNVGRMVDGLAFRVDRLKALGNGQVPKVAKTAWEILTSTPTTEQGE